MSLLALLLFVAVALAATVEVLALISRRWPDTISERWKGLIRDRWVRLASWTAIVWIVWHIYFEEEQGFGPPIWWDDVAALIIGAWTGLVIWRLQKNL